MFFPPLKQKKGFGLSSSHTILFLYPSQLGLQSSIGDSIMILNNSQLNRMARASYNEILCAFKYLHGLLLIICGTMHPP